MESTSEHNNEGRSAGQSDLALLDLALLDNASKAVNREATWPRVNPLFGCLMPLAHLCFAGVVRDPFRWRSALLIAALVALFGAATWYLHTRRQVRVKPGPRLSFKASLFSAVVFQATLWGWGLYVAEAPSGQFFGRAAVAYPLTALVFVVVFAFVNRRRPDVTLT